MEVLQPVLEEDIVFTLLTKRLTTNKVYELMEKLQEFISKLKEEDLSEKVMKEVIIKKSLEGEGHHTVYLSYHIPNASQPRNESKSPLLQTQIPNRDMPKSPNRPFLPEYPSATKKRHLEQNNRDYGLNVQPNTSEINKTRQTNNINLFNYQPQYNSSPNYDNSNRDQSSPFYFGDLTFNKHSNPYPEQKPANSKANVCTIDLECDENDKKTAFKDSQNFFNTVNLEADEVVQPCVDDMKDSFHEVKKPEYRTGHNEYKNHKGGYKMRGPYKGNKNNKPYYKDFQNDEKPIKEGPFRKFSDEKLRDDMNDFNFKNSQNISKNISTEDNLNLNVKLRKEESIQQNNHTDSDTTDSPIYLVNSKDDQFLYENVRRSYVYLKTVNNEEGGAECPGVIEID